MSDTTQILKFMPYSSCINPSFWFELNRIKLEDFKLDDSYKPLLGQFSNSSSCDLPPIVNFDYSSFNNKNSTQSTQTNQISGHIKIFNTLNEFQNADKNKILNDFGLKIWSLIKNGSALDDPNSINTCLMINFAFYKVTLRSSKEQIFYDNLVQHGQSNLTYFAINKETLEICSIKDALKRQDEPIMFVFKDLNSKTNDPGWLCRNFLILLTYYLSERQNIHVLALRDRFKNGQRTLLHSILYRVDLFEINDDDSIVITGWERNEKGLLNARSVDMSQSMNKQELAKSAVDLNLKLMKWRVAENVDLNKIKNTRCLLLGSGTLGCNVARCLLGWGVSTITFVDNAQISYSNPVRQSLYSFEDCLDQTQSFKALKAAENLKKIYPGVNSTGHVLSIPMPGHFVSESISDRVKEDVIRLEKLVDQHDCIFLLMDTRESRWLPTLICASQEKFLINSALGFDSYLVMRHGLSKENEHEKLGCYFCNDIVGPSDSTKDRTLDQQCTVSRPGLSMIASALSVELMITCLQHPCGAYASNESKNDENESCLGLVPHQIRGYLHDYSNILVACQAFDKCTACCKSVIDEYRTHGFDFLLKVFNDSSYLEEISGLKALKMKFDKQEVNECMIEMSDSD